MLRAEVGMRVRCANKASAEWFRRERSIGQIPRTICKKRGICGCCALRRTIKRKAREQRSSWHAECATPKNSSLFANCPRNLANAPLPPESFRTCFVCATHAHSYFCPQHWLLCHLNFYKFEFEFDFWGKSFSSEYVLFFWVLELVISYSYSTRTQEPRIFLRRKIFLRKTLFPKENQNPWGALIIEVGKIWGNGLSPFSLSLSLISAWKPCFLVSFEEG